MPRQARVGDMSKGHWKTVLGIPYYFPPTPLVTGTSDTMSSGKPCCRVSDQAKPHVGHILGVPVPWIKHTPKALTGSSSTKINGLPAFRVGDRYDCGDTQAQGDSKNIVR